MCVNVDAVNNLVMEIGITTVSTPTHCSAFTYNSELRATAEANKVGDDWWISRIVVNPERYRNKGIGSALLEKLKELIRAEGGVSVLVTPGGYENNADKQFRFYKKHGFRAADTKLWFWKLLTGRASAKLQKR